MRKQIRAPPVPGICILEHLGRQCQTGETLDPQGWAWDGRRQGVTCIPDEVAEEIRALRENLDSFLANMGGQNMEETMVRLQVERMVINGLIPLPCTAMEAARFLGTYDTSSLLQKGTDDR